MIKIIDSVAIALLIILGLVHVCMTPVLYKTFDLQSLWFAGTGLAFVFLGLFNFSRISSKDILVKIHCTVANVLALVYGVFLVIKLVDKPHVWFSLFVLVFLFILSLLDLRSKE